jgi:acetoin utilization deacetylase AcuC-like enzyme
MIRPAQQPSPDTDPAFAMLTLLSPVQRLHHPHTYYSRGRMCTPQETADRIDALLEGVTAMGFDVRAPADAGMAPLLAVHDAGYLRFLETAHGRWKEMPADWRDEVISNVFVREPNARRGILAEAAA